MTPPRKPSTPGADSDREDQSLHDDEILTQLRDHIVEATFPTAVACPSASFADAGHPRTPRCAKKR
jgi:hypothetical protein